MKSAICFFAVFLFVSLFIVQCGGSSDSGSDSSDDGADSGSEDTGGGAEDTGDTVNTDKLINTPFEGLTIGDDLATNLFLCDEYRTDTIEEFPIKIFTAFFTQNQEEYIQLGLDIANDGIGFVAYELTDVWTDDVRVIYMVDDLSEYGNGTSGITLPIDVTFNGKTYAETIAPDWAVAITSGTAGTTGLDNVAAHELGHTSGIMRHSLINYETDSLESLEDGSLMASNSSGGLLTDYNFMMEMQGQIMEDHLSEAGDIVGDDPCEE